MVSKNSGMKMDREFEKLNLETDTETHKHIQTEHTLLAILVDPLFSREESRLKAGGDWDFKSKGILRLGALDLNEVFN